MLPFSANIANQANNGAPNGPLPQQVPSNPNNGPPNFMPFQGQPHAGFTPNAQNPTPFNNPNFVPGNLAATSLLGSASGMPHPAQQTNGAFGLQNLNAASGFPLNAPLANLVAQNLYSQQMFANGSMGGLNPNASIVSAQLALQNQLQGVSQLLNMVMSNPAQLGALSQLIGCGNQPQGVMPQNNNFMGLPQPNGIGQQGSLGQQRMFPSSNNQNAPQQYRAPNQQMQMNSCAPKQFPAPNQQMQMNPCAPKQFPVPNQQMQLNSCAPKQFPASNSQMQVNSCAAPSTGLSLPPAGLAMGYQGTQGNRDKMNFSTSNHRQNNNFNRDRGGASNWRDRPQNHFHQNMNGKPNFSSENSEKGSTKLGGTGTAIDESKAVKGRSLMMQYSEKEIQQWREERRKYYPTKANVEKKHVPDGKSSGDVDQEAKLRREQLKNILAKQAELGFDVPDIPSHYLSDQVGQHTEKDGRKRPFKQNERFQNRFNKRGRLDHRDRFSKQRGTGNQEPFGKNSHYASDRQKPDQRHAATQSTTRSPTLLEKLLKTDVKRDRSHLLQAFRFMVMNSFFQDESKPLKFPEVRVKESSENLPLEELGSELGGLTKIEELDALEDASDNTNVETPKHQVEEGELTD